MVAAHQSNLAEIAAGNAAKQQATTDEVRNLGATFVDMHTALDADLTTAAEQLGVDLPDAPTPAQEAELAAVTANSGAAFDTAWIAQQLAAHQTTLTATQLEVDTGSDATVVGLAEAAVPVIQQHIADLEVASGANGAPTEVQGGSGGHAAEQGARWPGPLAAITGVALLGAGGLLLVRSRRLA